MQNITRFNPHRKNGFSYNISFVRNAFVRNLKQLKTAFIFMMYGLRRVGKTTLMKQYMQHLIDQGTKRTQIIYILLDRPTDLEEFFYTYFTTHHLDPHKDACFFFLDEIQKVKDRQSQIKILYDLYPLQRFIITGSSSLHLQKKESLAGRITEAYIAPLSFDEYLRYIEKEYLLESPEVYAGELTQIAPQYFIRQFIDTIYMNDEECIEYLTSLKKKVINEDIAQIFPIEYPHLLLEIFEIICYQPGMLLDYVSLSNDLNYDRRTIQKYIWYLEQTHIIRTLYNYTSNQIPSSKKLKKVYPVVAGYIKQQGPQRMGSLFETYIITTYQAVFFWRERTHEVDMVLIDEHRKPIPVEIKRKNDISKKHYAGIHSFYTKFKLTKQPGYMINQQYRNTPAGIHEHIHTVPFWQKIGREAHES